MTSSEPVVRLTTGAVRGRARADGPAVFKGIPYARPPFGADRLREPGVPAGWDGTRDAFEFGPRPPQPATAISGTSDWTTDEGLDCLSVNVWTPDAGSGAGLPVLVWIYGGAYREGSADLPEYDGARLAAGGAVVVTVNYRVGFEGFAHVEGAPDNRGLLDQVAALRWVRDNIAGFGGDPGNVTVFGESAGAGSVAALLVMPDARGLFHRAIAQSVPGTYFSPELAGRVGAAIAHTAGHSATLDDLRESDPVTLLSAAREFTARMTGDFDTWGQLALTTTPYSPVVDGLVLPSAPWQALAAGSGGDVELIAGFNHDEYRLFHVVGGRLGLVDADELALTARVLGLPDLAGSYDLDDADAAYVRLMSDWLFRMPSALLADAHASAGGMAYAYELTWPAPGGDGIFGACHALDVPLVFGTLDAGLVPLLVGAPAPDAAVALSEELRSRWIAFAGKGDPGWARYTIGRREAHAFDAPSRDTADPVADVRDLWSAHVFGSLG
ncbi:carboxylesterase/lipase family protein [Flindersiella endophytica]